MSPPTLMRVLTKSSARLPAKNCGRDSERRLVAEVFKTTKPKTKVTFNRRIDKLHIQEIASQVRNSSVFGPHRLRIRASSAQRPHPGGDGPPDLVRRIFLNEMNPRDRDFGLRWPRADGIEIRAAAEERSGLGLYEQLGHITGRQPFRIGSHDRSHVGGFAVDRDLPRPGQRRPSPFAGLCERTPVLRL